VLETGMLSGILAGQKVVDFFVSKGAQPSQDVWVVERYLAGER